MRLNSKDILSAAVLISVALVGLYINGGFFGIGLEQHALGTARRMGPGYMPALTFWILLGLGLLVLGFATANGPDPLEKWTSLDYVTPVLGGVTFLAVNAIASGIEGWPSSGWTALGLATFAGSLVTSISPGWRKLFLIIASMALFGLLLESGGLMLSIVATVGLAVMADETQRLKGAIALILFLCVLCWVIFIYYLDIRVSVWPQF